jgi:NADH:ubiquinone reductase (non-electrogenic)
VVLSAVTTPAFFWPGLFLLVSDSSQRQPILAALVSLASISFSLLFPLLHSPQSPLNMAFSMAARPLIARAAAQVAPATSFTRAYTIAQQQSAFRSPVRSAIKESSILRSINASGQFRRVHAELSPKPAKKRAGFFRWTLRLAFLGLIGGAAWTAYGIYQNRNPVVQMEADPNKKTLVVLGTGWGAVSLLKNLDTENYNVIVISPRNYFLFTPLLPSCTTGTIEHRSIMEPIRNFLRHKAAAVKYYEAEVTKIDHEKKVVYMTGDSEFTNQLGQQELSYDMLVVGVGAENATFGIKGVKEHGCFLKEVGDAQKIRKRIMDCCETATFKDQSPEEVKRLLHMVVVGGGPTGVEFAGELQDFFENDLKKWIPEIADNFRVTLVEALPSVLPMFSKSLIEYTEQTFKEETIEIRTKTSVKNVEEKYIEAEYTNAEGQKVVEKIPYGLLVWATGNAVRPVVKDLMSQIPAQKDSRRGLAVNEYLVVKGTDNIWAVGDCAVANYAPTAQVASQEGSFLARLFGQMARTEELESRLALLSEEQSRATDKEVRDELLREIKELQRRFRRVKQMGPFEYSHQGSLAYIGSEKAVADISWLTGNLASGGQLTYLFWRSAYLSMCFSSK